MNDKTRAPQAPAKALQPLTYSVQSCPGECISRGVVHVHREGPAPVRERCPVCDGWGFVRVPVEPLKVVQQAADPKPAPKVADAR